MGLAERLFDGLRSSLEMRSDLDRLAATVNDLEDDVLDHEKRLIRIETMIEMGRDRATSRDRLPDQS